MSRLKVQTRKQRCLSPTLALDDESGALRPSPRPGSRTGNQQDQQGAPGSGENVQQQQIWKRVCFISSHPHLSKNVGLNPNITLPLSFENEGGAAA